MEQDHRTVKRRARLAMGYSSFRTDWKTLQGIETMHMINKGRVRWLAKGRCGRAGEVRSQAVRRCCLIQTQTRPFWSSPDFRNGTDGDIAYRESRNAPERVRSAFDTFADPPEFELYDLQSDPIEFDNIAGKPETAGIQSRLLAALNQAQRN